MAKKSAASAKISKPEFKQTSPDPLEEFNKFKDLQIVTMEAALDQAKRIDTWVSMRNDLGNFIKAEPSIEKVNHFVAYEVELFEKMLEQLKALDYETISKPDYEDLYANLLLGTEDCETLEDFFKAYLTWCTVKPWAENLFNLNRACVNGSAE